MRCVSPFELFVAQLAFLIGWFPSFAQADIFQWEYVDPADPSLGKQQSATLAPDGAGLVPGPGMNAVGKDLTMAYLAGFDLTGADIYRATLTKADLSGSNLTDAILQETNLTDADLSGANIRGANFGVTTRRGFTAEQLYSTASYQSGDLEGVGLGGNDLSGWDFSGQELTDAVFSGATLTGTDLSGATIRDAGFGNSGITAEQLYSTASYETGDLSRLGLFMNDLVS